MSLNYIRTYTGGFFYPDHIEWLEPNIVDIAHALSSMNRYNGHLQEFYSVAQHSVIVCELAGSAMLNANPKIDPQSFYKFMLQGLLHDATEAYMPDMPSPIKASLPDFIELEKKLQKRIYGCFGLPEDTHYIIKRYDKEIRGSEMKSLSTWGEGEDTLGIAIEPWGIMSSKKAFLDCYHSIINRML